MKPWLSALAVVAAASLAVHAQRAQAHAPSHWTTDAADNQRTGWNKQESILTKQNTCGLKLLGEMETGNNVRELHALMPVLVLGRLNTPSGSKQVGFVTGISDNIYAFDVDTGAILWQKHWDYVLPARGPAGGGGGGGGGGAAGQGR